MPLQSISGICLWIKQLIYKLSNCPCGSSSNLLRSTPDCWFTDYHLLGQNPWTKLQTVTKNPSKVSSLAQRKLCSVNLKFSALPECSRCAAFQVHCVTGALIRLGIVPQFWFLCSFFSVLFMSFAICNQYISVWNPFPCWYSASIVQKNCKFFCVFVESFSVLLCKK